MKSSRLPEAVRKERRRVIVETRDAVRDTFIKGRKRSTIQYRTTRKIFRKKASGRVEIVHDYGPYHHSSTRQRARYARQIAAGQLSMEGVDRA